MLNKLALIPRYQQWQHINQITDIYFYRNIHLRVEQMLFCLSFISPKFLEYEGLILREEVIPENWIDFKQQAQNNQWKKSDVEYVLNHLHISDIFLNDPDRDKIPLSVYLEIAQAICLLWQYSLKKMFPNKAFVVEVAQEDDDPEVFFYLIRSTKEDNLS